MRHDPVRLPEPVDKETSEIHNDLTERTSEGFVGITANNGIVTGVIGDLTDEDIIAVEDYIGVSLKVIDDYS